jgi:hypothetical protein
MAGHDREGGGPAGAAPEPHVWYHGESDAYYLAPADDPGDGLSVDLGDVDKAMRAALRTGTCNLLSAIKQRLDVEAAAVLAMIGPGSDTAQGANLGPSMEVRMLRAAERLREASAEVNWDADKPAWDNLLAAESAFDRMRAGLLSEARAALRRRT